MTNQLKTALQTLKRVPMNRWLCEDTLDSDSGPSDSICSYASSTRYKTFHLGDKPIRVAITRGIHTFVSEGSKSITESYGLEIARANPNYKPGFFRELWSGESPTSPILKIKNQGPDSQLAEFFREIKKSYNPRARESAELEESLSSLLTQL